MAIKKIRVREGVQEELDDALREVKILKAVKHESIACFIDMFTSRANIYIVMELMQCTLTDYINTYGSLEEKDAARVIKMVAAGVDHIHSKGFIHFDLKSTNILLSHDENKKIKDAKITDFGLTKENDKQFRAGVDTCGTLISMAPEMLQHNSVFDKRVDIWCLGIILYRMLCGEVPFKSENDEEIIQEIVMNEVDYTSGKWSIVSDEAKSLVQSLLQKDPEQRQTIQGLLSDPWVLQHGPAENAAIIP